MGFSEESLKRFQTGILLIVGELRAAEGLLAGDMSR
jgi:hypothetical protein